MLGRVRDTVADLAETLRRAFMDLQSHPVPVAIEAPGSRSIPTLEGRSGPPVAWPEARPSGIALVREPFLVEAALGFNAQLREESAWARWAAGAKVCTMPVFRAEACPRLDVPPLPRAARTGTLAPQSFQTRVWQRREPILPARTRGESMRLPAPGARRGLDLVLGLPVAVASEDIQRLSKALWMRYTLQLVKSTGQNIRSLDVLGLYRIPAKGVAGLGHDSKSGRLLLELSMEASGAPRRLFLLARCKEDRRLVSCFLEDEE